MNRYTLYTSLLLMLSCNSVDNVVENFDSEAVQQVVFGQWVENWEGMLHFQSIDDFHAVMNSLAIEDSIRSADYTEHPDSTMIYPLALTEFEQSLGFESLRKQLFELERHWLEDGMNPNEDPTRHWVSDKYMQTLLNPACELRIGESVYCLYENDYAVEITDHDLPTLNWVRNNVHTHEDVLALFNSETENIIVHIDGEPFPVYSGIESSCDDAKPSLTIHQSGVNYLEFSIIVDASNVPSGWYREYAEIKIYGQTPSVLIQTYTVYPQNFNSTIQQTHTFTTPGVYKICATLRLRSQDPNSLEYCEMYEVCKKVSAGTCCDRNDRYTDDTQTYNNGDNRIKVKLSALNISILFTHHIRVETENYERRSNGKFRQAKVANIYASVVGGSRYWTDDCTNEVVFVNPFPGIDTNARSVARRYPILNKFQIRRNSVTSVHEIISANAETLAVALQITRDCSE